MLVKNHREGKTNHGGTEKTLQYLKRSYYLENINTTITKYTNTSTKKQNNWQTHNSKSKTSTEFKLNQIVYKKKLFSKNKKDNKFIGPHTTTNILDFNNAETKSYRNSAY